MAAIALFLAVNVAHGETVSSAELINNAKQHDGETVNYEGEIIGDIMTRGNYTWLNVSDGQNAIGIYISAPMTKDITCAGSYKCKGDRVEIAGIFHRSCQDHGGDMDIHASMLRKTAPGKKTMENTEYGKIKVAVALLVTLIALVILDLWLARKRLHRPRAQG